VRVWARRLAGLAIIWAIAWFLIGYASATPACAHDPRFVCSPRNDAAAVSIPDASKSWAYYGALAPGQRDDFTFTLARPVRIPWSLLVDRRDAAIPGRPDAVLTRDASTISHLHFGEGARFYEPFSRLSYLESPSVYLDLPPGVYRIQVTMRGGAVRQRYVMAIGETERFGIGEIPYVLGAIQRIRERGY
jgi:hypothetical protein